jgi:excisionase family DNA binding protein
LPEVLSDGCVGIHEAVRFSGLSRSTLYAAMDIGELAFVKIGRRRLLPRRALVEWLAFGLRGGEKR